MFKYEELTIEEKEFIEILGDHTKSKPLEPYTGIKSLKKIYEDYYYIKKTFEDLIKLTDRLYFHGLISYVPATINSVNNIMKSSRETLETHFSIEKTWRNQDYFIRLTVGGERTINGTDVYFQITKENLTTQYEKLHELVSQTNEMEKEYLNIKNKLDSSMIRNIEVLTIFIAIVAIIGGNISVFQIINLQLYLK